MIRLPTPILAIAALLIIPALYCSPSTSAGEAGSSPLQNPPPILVSRQLLEGRGLSVGDVVLLAADPSGTGASPFRVVGSYEPTPDPMRFTSKRLEARLHLPDLLALAAEPEDPLSMESVTAINVVLNDPADAAGFARDLTSRMPTLAALPTSPPENEANVFTILERFHMAIALVTVIGSTAFLLALMVMRADERRETVGILRLIGVSKQHILRGVLLEGLFIAVAGSLFGVLFTWTMEDVFNLLFQWRYDTSLVFVRVTVGIAWRCVALAVPLGVLAGLVASWTLLRRDIVALVRR